LGDIGVVVPTSRRAFFQLCSALAEMLDRLNGDARRAPISPTETSGPPVAGRLWNPMQTQTVYSTSQTHRRPPFHLKAVPTTAPSAAPYRGLSRAELRDIVLEQLG
jgi:hypothetical protein